MTGPGLSETWRGGTWGAENRAGRGGEEAQGGAGAPGIGLQAYARAEAGGAELSKQLTGSFSKQGRPSLPACWSCSQAAALLGSGSQGGPELGRQGWGALPDPTSPVSAGGPAPVLSARWEGLTLRHDSSPSLANLLHPDLTGLSPWTSSGTSTPAVQTDPIPSLPDPRPSSSPHQAMGSPCT